MHTQTEENGAAMFVLFVNMPGHLPDEVPEPFEATEDQAIDALLSEAIDQLDEDGEDDEVVASDRAFVQSFNTFDGRADLVFVLRMAGEVGIRLESYANSFGGVVTLRAVA